MADAYFTMVDASTFGLMPACIAHPKEWKGASGRCLK